MAVTAKQGDITKLKGVDVLVIPSNGIGVFGPNAESIVKAASGKGNGKGFLHTVRETAIANGFDGYAPGKVYATDPGMLFRNGYKAIFHAVTNRYPNEPSSYETIEQCLPNVFEAAIRMGVKSIAIQNLGRGIENIDPTVLARQTVKVAQRYADKLEVTVIENDSVFIEAAATALAA